jgi:peptidoglycan/xylan/chitin deacetylase (PgdA/CDA1 family)
MHRTEGNESMLKSHNRYRYVPITERKSYAWPNGARLAIFTALNVEAFPFAEGMGVELAPGQPQPDVVNYSWRDYGNRVGFWRLLEMLEEFEIPASMLMNTEIFDECPQIAEAIMKRGDEIVGHGRTNAERQGQMPEEEERRLIESTALKIREKTGRVPSGWLGPWVSESHVTLDLLQEAGFSYHMDWMLDDQPVWMRTRKGRILSVPYVRPTNDLPLMHRYQLTPAQYADILIDQFDEMLKQAQKMPLVFCLSFHPYFAGHAFRIRHLRRVYRHIANHGSDVWLARTGEIANHVINLPPGVVPG